MENVKKVEINQEWNKYSYSKGQEVSIDGTLFYVLMEFLDQLRQENSETFYEPMYTEDGTYEGLNPRVFFKRDGVTAVNFLDEFLEVHSKNIDSGVAKLVSELQKEEIKLVESPQITDANGMPIKSNE